jgi:hypothetical protein
MKSITDSNPRRLLYKIALTYYIEIFIQIGCQQSITTEHVSFVAVG